MNKQVILNALRQQLWFLEQNLMYDKLEAATYWEKSDKSRPVETCQDYINYRFWKNQVRSNQKKLKTLRETIRAVKCLK